jgi:hypothetical protein
MWYQIIVILIQHHSTSFFLQLLSLINFLPNLSIVHRCSRWLSLDDQMAMARLAARARLPLLARGGHRFSDPWVIFGCNLQVVIATYSNIQQHAARTHRHYLPPHLAWCLRGWKNIGQPEVIGGRWCGAFSTKLQGSLAISDPVSLSMRIVARRFWPGLANIS